MTLACRKGISSAWIPFRLELAEIHTKNRNTHTHTNPSASANFVILHKLGGVPTVLCLLDSPIPHIQTVLTISSW